MIVTEPLILLNQCGVPAGTTMMSPGLTSCALPPLIPAVRLFGSGGKPPVMNVPPRRQCM